MFGKRSSGQRISLLGTSVYAVNLESTLDTIEHHIQNRLEGYICLAPAHNLMACRADGIANRQPLRAHLIDEFNFHHGVVVHDAYQYNYSNQAYCIEPRTRYREREKRADEAHWNSKHYREWMNE